MKHNGSIEESMGVIEERTTEYRDMGIPPRQAKTAAARDMGFSNGEVAEMLGVGERTASSYYSDFKTKIQNALQLVVATSGGPTTILAEKEWDRSHRLNVKYVVAELCCGRDNVAMFEDAQHEPPEGRFRVLSVTTGGSSGQPDGTVSISSSDVYESLEQLAEENYEQASIGLERAKLWYTLLGKAGGNAFQQSLSHPDSRIPRSHPDHPEHEQWQLQQYENRSER